MTTTSTESASLEPDNTSAPECWLLTSLGTNAVPTSYRINGRVVTAPLGPIALLEAFAGDHKRINRVVVVTTTDVTGSTLPILRAHCDAEQIPIDCLSVAPDVSPDTFVQMVAQCIPGGVALDLTIDLTQGFRHFSLLLYSTALFLQALRPEVTVRHCYYALLGSGHGGDESALIDLAPLLTLQQLLYALNTFRFRLDLQPLVELLSPHLPTQNPESLRKLRLLASALNLRLPLDVATIAEDFKQHRKPITKSLRQLELPVRGVS